jgi:hypothetical protein
MYTCERCGSDWCEQPIDYGDLFEDMGPKCPLCGWVVDGPNDIWTIEITEFLEDLKEEK